MRHSLSLVGPSLIDRSYLTTSLIVVLYPMYEEQNYPDIFFQMPLMHTSLTGSQIQLSGVQFTSEKSNEGGETNPNVVFHHMFQMQVENLKR